MRFLCALFCVYVMDALVARWVHEYKCAPNFLSSELSTAIQELPFILPSISWQASKRNKL